METMSHPVLCCAVLCCAEKGFYLHHPLPNDVVVILVVVVVVPPCLFHPHRGLQVWRRYPGGVLVLAVRPLRLLPRAHQARRRRHERREQKGERERERYLVGRLS